MACQTGFRILDSVLHRNVKRIEEYSAGFLKAHAVLALVGEVLRLVPLESQTFHAIIIIIKV
jgi:hypothetical protein